MSSEPVAVKCANPDISSSRPISTTVLSRTKIAMPEHDVGTVTSNPDPGRVRYNATPADIIAQRYLVGDFVDQGGFGAVYKATDLYTGAVVAVKVFHKGQPPHRDIRTEELVYAKLVAGCSANICFFAEVMGSGEHRGHRFLVQEMCGPSLFKLLSMKMLLPLPRRHVQEIAFQVFEAVSYMHSLGFIHADLKPDNIALKTLSIAPLRYYDPVDGFRTCHRLVSTQICVLDLGGVVEESEDGHQGVVGAVNYRAPEISLGVPYDHSVDIFSAGCVLAELYLGREFLPRGIASEREHVALIERICGPFPVDVASDVEQFKPGTFHIQDSTASVRFPSGEFNANVHVEPLRRLQRAKPISFRIHDICLGNLLRRLLDPDPCKRLELNQALRHAYFDELRTRRM